MANVTPTTRTASRSPVGTLQELRDLGLDPLKFGCCAVRQRDTNGNYVVIGCKHAEYCQFPERSESGPLNVNVRFIKPGGRIREVVATCYDAMEHFMKMDTLNDVLVEIGGTERNPKATVILKGSRPSATLPPLGQEQRWEPLPLDEQPIPAFPRPKDNPGLAEARYHAKQQARSKTEKQNMKREALRAKNLGLDEPGPAVIVEGEEADAIRNRKRG